MGSLCMPTRDALTGARTWRRDCPLQSGGALRPQGGDRVGGCRRGSHSPHVCKELLKSLLPMHRPELEPGCSVAGVVQAFMEGPVLVQYQAEAGSKVKEHMWCPLLTNYLELTVAYNLGLVWTHPEFLVDIPVCGTLFCWGLLGDSRPQSSDRCREHLKLNHFLPLTDRDAYIPLSPWSHLRPLLYVQSHRLCSLADALPLLHLTLGALCPHQCPSFPTPRAQGPQSTLLQLSAAFHMTQTSSVASKQTTITQLKGGYGWLYHHGDGTESIC